MPHIRTEIDENNYNNIKKVAKGQGLSVYQLTRLVMISVGRGEVEFVTSCQGVEPSVGVNSSHKIYSVKDKRAKK